MISAQLVDTILTWVIRRGLTALGTAGASVSDDWISTTVSLLIAGGNELYQARQAHKVKADGAKETPATN